ncbi:monovalent cation/H(+) antiporter subunit G [Streptomyces sp. NPDC018693]|uniref:monovalent cation/H(+) antiporter subunit G n=1 Tax=unclassified Streptomyces TaxID=2593676 RepID=UPI0037987CBF
MSVLDVLSGVSLIVGALAVLTGAVGMLRFPDFYTRIHAAGVTDSAGAGLILLGLLLRVDAWDTAMRLLIILLFLALTGPTATHILAHAARRDGVPMWREGDPRQ